MNYELISAIIVYSFLFFIIYKNRKKFQIMDKIFIVYKWDKGVDFIKKFSKKYLIVFYTIGIPICLFFMIFSVKMMWEGALMIFSSPNPEPTVALAIPGVKIPGSPIYIPFWYGIIALITVLVSHELSHGISATIEKIKLKSTGVGLMAILPLAFVEPEQKSYNSAKKISRIRMLIAGSFANITLAGISILLVTFFFYPLIDSTVTYDGVIISSTVSEGPASLAGVSNNSRMLEINNESFTNITGFHHALSLITPGEAVSLLTNESYYEFNASSHPDNESMAYLGVFAEQEWRFKEELSALPLFILNIPFILANIFMWIANLNLAIGIINLFPLWITDGGKLLVEIISPLFKDQKKSMIIAHYIFIICLSLLLFNLLGAYFINAVNSIALQ
ncbi:MAG: site-2 protease family protein [Candidatus Nanoarchaeia archaeon]|nr:site-2 protease family protein [Candidatus Nanoarchaeia archaeon]MDD5499361.1 site-2 protease family protein [Candidatus Nanoarchaeia archaeon]